MIRWLWRSAALSITLLAMPAIGHATEVPHLTLARALRALGGSYTVPAAWSGVWAYMDTTRECVTLNYVYSESGLDTLCTGQTYQPDTTGGIQYNCTGTVSDTQADLTCTGSFELYTGCTVNFSSVVHATRSGDTTYSHETFTTTYVPTGCAFLSDSCEEYYSHATRIAPQPAGCSTPTRQRTWGELKSTYR